jgi:hypothetical protein
MREVIITTKSGKLEYPVTVLQFESLGEAYETWTGKGLDAEAVNLGTVNAAQEQNAKQGGKGDVRKQQALGFADDSPEVAEAVEKAQAYSIGYVLGSPRGGTLASGQTRTEAREMGVSIASNATPEQLAEINAILGL